MLFRCKVVGERDQASVAMLNLFVAHHASSFPE
jgi:hypothetical protein